MGTTNTLDLNNRVTNLEGLTASDIMMSDGVTSVEEAVDELKSGLISIDKVAQYIFNPSTMTDFNNLLTDKAMTIYQIGYTTNMANKPSSGTFGLLVVYRVTLYYVQMWLPADGNLMHRTRTDNNWSNWR